MALGSAAVDYAGMASASLPRPTQLVAAAVAPGCSDHQRQLNLVRASLIARG
jgi:hypothetical protein